ncbi:hypothetical protein CC80DRAFT_552889 [Byssothecium circinans]|uniref:Uncharacterized protein n=1 Tax=Byssothecium circinans TaxID=147558 RepID=A0A6A5TS90_9PLEO|nr:hypothetical protein CC80DRAFT_552889 [Byssothecium circinans]
MDKPLWLDEPQLEEGSPFDLSEEFSAEHEADKVIVFGTAAKATETLAGFVERSKNDEESMNSSAAIELRAKIDATLKKPNDTRERAVAYLAKLGSRVPKPAPAAQAEPADPPLESPSERRDDGRRDSFPYRQSEESTWDSVLGGMSSEKAVTSGNTVSSQHSVMRSKSLPPKWVAGKNMAASQHIVTSGKNPSHNIVMGYQKDSSSPGLGSSRPSLMDVDALQSSLPTPGFRFAEQKKQSAQRDAEKTSVDLLVEKLGGEEGLRKLSELMDRAGGIKGLEDAVSLSEFVSGSLDEDEGGRQDGLANVVTSSILIAGLNDDGRPMDHEFQPVDSS